MDPRQKSAVLWGLVGAMAVVVAAQGYLVVGESLPIGIAAVVWVAIAVGIVTAIVTYAVEYRLLAKGRT
ncbi:hypothetical protein [Halalkalirubrum salinum]|uniref:hypothetical protein n=1 Tax=Halalkalirubrum salinum TaxID=2563889 RepID=UPI0010FB8EAB|nr:hypothetical protein [Halalkalirubrum salinum]